MSHFLRCAPISVLIKSRAVSCDLLFKFAGIHNFGSIKAFKGFLTTSMLPSDFRVAKVKISFARKLISFLQIQHLYQLNDGLGYFCKNLQFKVFLDGI